MSRRPSVFVLALTVGDYLLWNWSLNASHDAIALVSGLTLPPLALISFWVLALGAMRVLAATAQTLRGREAPHARYRASAGGRTGSDARPSTTGARAAAAERTAAAGAPEESRRIAA